MSLLWKIPLEGDEEGFLFTKMSLKEAKYNVCQANIKLNNAGPTNLKVHLAKHPTGVMENAEEAEKESMKQGLEEFVVRGTGELSALDRRIMHLVAC